MHYISEMGARVRFTVKSYKNRLQTWPATPLILYDSKPDWDLLVVTCEVFPLLPGHNVGESYRKRIFICVCVAALFCFIYSFRATASPASHSSCRFCWVGLDLKTQHLTWTCILLLLNILAIRNKHLKTFNIQLGFRNSRDMDSRSRFTESTQRVDSAWSFSGFLTQQICKNTEYSMI